MESTEKSVQYKLFAGFKVNLALKNALTNSRKWQEAAFDKKITPLKEVKHKDMTFIGIYLDSSSLSLQEIAELEERLQNELSILSNEYTPEPLSLRFFSQPFIH